MTEIDAPWKYPRHKAATLETKRAAMLTALSVIDAKSPRPTTRLLNRIAREYMFENSGMVWPIWQALVNNSKTPPRVLRDFEQKQMWFLDILLVQHANASEAFLHRMKNLREDIQGKNSNSKGFDNNKELRVYAYKRLGLRYEENED